MLSVAERRGRVKAVSASLQANRGERPAKSQTVPSGRLLQPEANRRRRESIDPRRRSRGRQERSQNQRRNVPDLEEVHLKRVQKLPILSGRFESDK